MTNTIVMPAGKYKGVPIQQLPTSYCRWILGQDFPEEIRKIAQEKVAKNQTSTIEIDVTRHAIDSFSLRFLDRWDKQKGLATFIAERAVLAYENGTDVSKTRHKDEEYRILFDDIVWVFNRNTDFKVLITVIEK